MRFKFQNRNNQFNPILLGKDLEKKDSKERTVENFGSFPDDLTINSPENQSLLRETVKVVEKRAKNEMLHSELKDKELVDLLNNQDTGPCYPVMMGSGFISRVLDDFRLDASFRRWQRETKRGYSLQDYFEFYISHIIIHPGSILYYYNTSQEYNALLKEPIKEQDLYDFLTFFYPHRLEFQRIFFETTIKLLGPQKVHIFFYDGTNYTCWNSVADPEHLDLLDGKIKEGLRQFGLAKSKRFDKPVVAMGIISTTQEIPLFYSIFPGNRPEINFIKEDIKNLNQSLLDLDLNIRDIITADAGLNSGDLQYWIAGSNDYTLREGAGFILGRSINNVDRQTLDWALETKGYYPISRGRAYRLSTKKSLRKITRVKSRIITKEVDVKLKDGRKIKKTVRVKQICVFSEKSEYRALKILNKNIEKIKELEDNPKKLKAFLKRKLGKYIDLLGIFNETGEVTKDFLALINSDSIEEEARKAGLFIIETSETDWPDGKVLHDYREKYHIEHLIRTMKGVLQASPAYVYTYEHIFSHYDLCALSLTTINYIKVKCLRLNGIELSPMRIQFLLQQFTALSIRNNHIFMIPDVDNDTQTMLETFDVRFENTFETIFNIKKIFKLK